MNDTPKPPAGRTSPWDLAVGPPPERWDDWVELDAKAWPERKERHFDCVPTICFNCESACGLLAFVDKATGQIEKFEGNPVHPGSRGRTCAKGPATLNQIQDTERILTPLKRVGKRGAGTFVPVTWKEALADIGSRIRKALDEGRHDEVMYHVGRPGEDHFMQRLLGAWGVDGLNTHTNVCSSAARLGYQLWMGADRPSPDYSDTRFILLLSAHLETGHYFNPHAQRIMAAKEAGARIAVVDTRLSNTASHADLWISPWPGTEAAMLLGVARELLASRRFDAAYFEKWTNWQKFLEKRDPDGPRTFDRFITLLTESYAQYTPEFVAAECRIPVDTVPRLADEIAAAKGKFASHLWRNTAAGNLGGWQVVRALVLLHAMTGSVGTPGGVNPNSWDKFAPKPVENPPPVERWNELLFPTEYPLAHYEMSFLLPHLMRVTGKKVDTYFSRVYNPVWINPDGCAWIEMLEDETRMGCHVALTPIWSETAQWADYILPTGLGPERHDLMSQETHAGTWLGFRQPVLRILKEKAGQPVNSTLGTNPGEVWEEAEFWVALTWEIDPDGSRGIRKYYESKTRPGTPVTMDEYFGGIFQNSVPGLPEAASAQGLSPLAYMRRYGAFDVPYAGQRRFETEVNGKPVGFKTPSTKLEVYSTTMEEWGHPDQAIPGYIRSQVHWQHLNEPKGERVLLPTFRLPTLVHTRSGNSKWLQEISHTNPLWVNPDDIQKLRLANGGLARVSTRIGYFVLRVWETEGIHPGIVACSHHMGRWRLHREVGGEKLSTALVEIQRTGGTFMIRQKESVKPFESSDPDTQRIWWKEAGVNQNLTFPVQPDPISGMHCWHQLVTVEPARPEDRYGDIFVDTAKSDAVFREWFALAQKDKRTSGLRRPMWLNRPGRPADRHFTL